MRAFQSATGPDIYFIEEVMREGMQIEDARIPVEAKVELLDALSETGLPAIVVGSFVSPKYTPQMARIEELVARFKPRPGVTYLALALNARGVERAQEFSPPLTVERGAGTPTLMVHMCDVFVRRNVNRSQADEVADWPAVIERAVAGGARAAGIGLNAAFGSNFLGEFPLEAAMRFLEVQHALWEAAGIPVTAVRLGDPMGWCHPAKVTRMLRWIRERWPGIRDFGLHLHNSRGMVLPCIYAALLELGKGDVLRLDGALGGVGGCPYCGNGRATGLAPTEDLLHMLEGMGYATGVDFDKLIGCVDLLERMLGRMTWGHVSRAGPRPLRREDLTDINAPFIETLEQARHFRDGPDAYANGIVPWKDPIVSAYRERVDRGLPAYEVDGDWPWRADFFPKVPERGPA